MRKSSIRTHVVNKNAQAGDDTAYDLYGSAGNTSVPVPPEMWSSFPEKETAGKPAFGGITQLMDDLMAIPGDDKKLSSLLKPIIKNGSDLDRFLEDGHIEGLVIDIPMQGKNLRGANCRDTIWTTDNVKQMEHALLEGADFTGAQGLTDEHFAWAYTDQNTVLPAYINRNEVERRQWKFEFNDIRRQPPLLDVEVEAYRSLQTAVHMGVEIAMEHVEPGQSEKDLFERISAKLEEEGVTEGWRISGLLNVYAGARTTGYYGLEYKPREDQIIKEDDIVQVSVYPKQGNTTVTRTETYYMDSGGRMTSHLSAPRKLSAVFQLFSDIKDLVLKEAQADMRASELVEKIDRLVQGRAFSVDTSWLGYASHNQSGHGWSGAKVLSADNTKGVLGDFEVMVVSPRIKAAAYENRIFEKSTAFAFSPKGRAYTL